MEERRLDDLAELAERVCAAADVVVGDVGLFLDLHVGYGGVDGVVERFLGERGEKKGTAIV